MKNLKFEKFDKIGIITLNRPEKMNALSMELLSELETLVRKISEERSEKVIIIKGAGKNFSSGHDLKEILNKPPYEVERLFLKCFDVMRAIRDAPQPYIAQVHGIAAAAGCQLVAACDLAVAARSAKFSTPGVNIGLFCFTPIVFVSRNVSRKKAFEMGITGDLVDAEEALKIGLVNRVVDDEKLEEETMSLAKKIARFSLNVLESGKRFFYKQLPMEDFQALSYATETIALYSSTKDAVEGISAFFEKREPRWN
ncbi:MAG: enoyl-CoA hydratase-related protein [Archaeoglobaceae archaeon]|nr:enoyl-CoA hydratase-related protein [Archaeoglobaceae archaeon]MCX8151770.1 enoyl-CoA hydratase-related protein [Archaeoglobaceae archaeon]MDW8013205.1 enoyl-CoA hydratase-related protein [Archaeoglobaceae archaeon]